MTARETLKQIRGFHRQRELYVARFSELEVAVVRPRIVKTETSGGQEPALKYNAVKEKEDCKLPI